jgi:Fe2+ or Zn2+ uptake regulation protein
MPDSSSKLFVTAIDRLKASGGRMTKKRELLLGALLTFDRPASAEEPNWPSQTSSQFTGISKPLKI